MKYLKELCLASSVSGDEKEVRKILYKALEKNVDECFFDGLGSFISKKGSTGPKVALVSHMDEVGFMVKHIDENGYLYIEAIGSWFNQTMLNQKVKVKDFSNKEHIGIIGSIAPHSLSEQMKKKPIEIDDMFVDLGYQSQKEVLEAGIEVGNFICPYSEYEEFGNDKIMVKALDNRVGVSLVIDTMQQINNPNIKLYGVGTVQEEVGLRGAQTSASTIKADIAIALDVIVAGDTPLMNKVKYSSNLGDGPSLALFDMRAIPNQKLQREVEQIAQKFNIPIQKYTLKTGATDAGRYNVMEGGCPVITIAVPTRYIHANHSVISKKDYEQTAKLIKYLVEEIDNKFIDNIKNFLD